MYKHIISIILILTLLLPVALSSCGGDQGADTEPEISSSAEQTEPEPELFDPDEESILLYYEDFEDIDLSSDSAKTAQALGWICNTSGDASLPSNSAQYQIADNEGSRRLYIKNGDSDSFIILLSDNQFSYLEGQGYTYQYDLIYADSASAADHIALITEFEGAGYYNSANICSGGFGNNENFSENAAKQYDSAVAAQDDTSLASLLLGKTAQKDAFAGISMSVRYIADRENGNRLYVRINTEGYPGSGKWTLVSRYRADSAAADCLDPAKGGSGFAIKTSGGQSGYIDNIMIWSGKGDEPADKSAPMLSSSLECHRLIATASDTLCMICGKNSAELTKGWLLDEAPAYIGGSKYTRKAYLTGQGVDPEQPLEKEGRMQIISDTTEAEFKAYTAELEDNGYALEFSRDADNNLYRSYIKEGQRIYTYFLSGTAEARVITEQTEFCLSAEEFGYEYAPKEGESSSIYQYALPMRDKTHKKASGFVDRGMLYVVKLADNSLIVIDGGEATQYPDEQVENLMAFLREISGVGETGKIKIAAWYLTHAHSDHHQGFGILIKKYSSDITLERVIYNLPSANSENATAASVGSAFKKMLEYIKLYCGDVKFYKPHTGCVLQLGDVTIETLYTHEDLVNPVYGINELEANYNEASMVSKFTFGGGKTFLVTGDIDSKAAAVLLENITPETLKVDVLQIAHHVLNDLTDLYHVTQAPVIFVPQSLDRIREHSVAPKPYAAALQYVKNDMKFFQNTRTIGLGVVNGEISQIYSRAIVYKVKNSDW